MKTVFNAVNEFKGEWPNIRYTTDGWYVNQVGAMSFNGGQVCTSEEFNQCVDMLIGDPLKLIKWKESRVAQSPVMPINPAWGSTLSTPPDKISCEVCYVGAFPNQKHCANCGNDLHSEKASTEYTQVMADKGELSHAELKSRLLYCEESGEFMWNIDVANIKAGDAAGCVAPSGYILIRLNKKIYRAHRLAWFYVYGEWPSDNIDHIDHNKSNNSILNLRVVSHQENCKNKSMMKNNTSGFNGVSWHKQSGKWRAKINVSGVEKNLGTFESLEDAVKAREDANNKYSFHGNHGVKPLTPPIELIDGKAYQFDYQVKTQLEGIYNKREGKFILSESSIYTVYCTNIQLLEVK